MEISWTAGSGKSGNIGGKNRFYWKHRKLNAKSKNERRIEIRMAQNLSTIGVKTFS